MNLWLFLSYTAPSSRFEISGKQKGSKIIVVGPEMRSNYSTWKLRLSDMLLCKFQQPHRLPHEATSYALSLIGVNCKLNAVIAHDLAYSSTFLSQKNSPSFVHRRFGLSALSHAKTLCSTPF